MQKSSLLSSTDSEYGTGIIITRVCAGTKLNVRITVCVVLALQMLGKNIRYHSSSCLTIFVISWRFAFGFE